MHPRAGGRGSRSSAIVAAVVLIVLAPVHAAGRAAGGDVLRRRGAAPDRGPGRRLDLAEAAATRDRAVAQPARRAQRHAQPDAQPADGRACSRRPRSCWSRSSRSAGSRTGTSGEESGGSGGFPLLAEADSPVFQDLTGEASLTDVERTIQKAYQDAGKPADERDAQDRGGRARLLQATTVYPFRVRAGDDASCLNLYQATRPRVLGVPDALIDRGGFRFSSHLARDRRRRRPTPGSSSRQTGDASRRSSRRTRPSGS